MRPHRRMLLVFFVWVRDNLTLNLVLLAHPVEAIRTWQSTGQPMP